MHDDIIDLIAVVVASEAPETPASPWQASPTTSTHHHNSNHSFTYSTSPPLPYPADHVDHRAPGVSAASSAMEAALQRSPIQDEVTRIRAWYCGLCTQRCFRPLRPTRPLLYPSWLLGRTPREQAQRCGAQPSNFRQRLPDIHH